MGVHIMNKQQIKEAIAKGQVVSYKSDDVFVVDGYAFGLWAKNSKGGAPVKIHEHEYQHCYIGKMVDSGLHLTSLWADTVVGV